jgi:hypothetical protein
MPTSRVNYYPFLVLAFSLVLIGVFAGPQIVDFGRGEANSVWHLESVSLSLYGRFHGSALVTDAYSGEFPTFYNFLSDWLINLIAYATGLPPFEVQAVIYVPFLATLLFVGSYLSIRAVGLGQGVALFAAVLVVGAGETPFVHYLYTVLRPLSGLSQASGNLIPPAESIGVASSQGLGWGLFLPVLSSLYCARRRDHGTLSFFAGALLGICCLAHTLTFLQLATTVSVYVAVDGILSLIQAGRVRGAMVRAGVIVAVTALLAIRGETAGLSMLNFVILWSTCFLASLIDVRNVRFAAIYGAGAVIVASPYLLQVWQLSLQVGRFEGGSYTRVSATEFILFYLVCIVSTVIVLFNVRRLDRPDLLILLAVALVVPVGMGFGAFGLHSHAYRFWTNAIIPFGVLAALSLTIPPSLCRRIVVGVLAPLMLIGVVRNLWVVQFPLPRVIARTVGLVTSYNGAIPLPVGAPVLLDRVREQTSTLPPGSRVLLPPEYQYPQQAYRNGLLLAVSRVPGFIPDPRYVVWQDLYADRVAVFCSLFPSYPHLDMHTQARICDETPKELAPGHLDLIYDRAVPDVLSLYQVKFLALLRAEPADIVARQAQRLGMKPIYDETGDMLWQIASEPDQDRLSFGTAAYGEPDLSIPMTAQRAGRYIIVLAGRAIASRVRQVRLGQTSIESHSLGADAIGLSVDLPEGTSELKLTLAPDPRLRNVLPTPIRMIVGVRQEVADKFLTGPSLQELMR